MKKLLKIILWLTCLPCMAQTAAPINQPVFRAFDVNGAPLAGGMLWSYAAGTTTPKDTFTDATLGTPNRNPFVLDSSGQGCRGSGGCGIFLGSGGYKFILQNSLGVQQWTIDGVQGPLAPGVNTFNSRTGTVVPANGDYTCSMVTGAVCTVATPFYQTVKVGGSSQTQEPALNLIAGTHTTIACTDNAGVSTDCTITNTAPGDSATTCNSNGCFYTKADGLIVQFGVSGAFGTGSPSANVLVTFPTTFTTTLYSIQTNPDDCNANNCSGNSALSTNPSAASTSGMTIHLATGVLVGGSGSNITGTIHAYWQAIGR